MFRSSFSNPTTLFLLFFTVICILNFHLIESSIIPPKNFFNNLQNFDDSIRFEKRRIGLRLPHIIRLDTSVVEHTLTKRRLGHRLPNIHTLTKRRLGHRLPNIVRMRLQNGENPFLGE
uniref:Ribosomal protein S13 n=1 Tax=Panagrolaimus sp. JU765 TaxID=591449 RepID=A0AC34PVS4_9BILA